MPMEWEMDSPRIRVVVVAEQDALAVALTTALVDEHDVLVRIPVSDATPAIELLDSGAAQLAVIDLDRLDGAGYPIITEIRDRTGAPVLAASLELDPEIPVRALAAGACGMLPMDDRAHEIARAIRRAVAGELVLPDRDLPGLVERMRSPMDPFHVLTPREREILRLLTKGLATAEIAAILTISRGTVQVHVKNILAKLGIHSKVEAVRLALLAGSELSVGSRPA
jgi:DNA-binding NarL/FixJ family response regulator